MPLGLPALTRAAKLGKRAAQVGFDWPDLAGPRAKIDEELRELDQVLCDPAAADQRHAELGDLLYSVVNLARHLDIDPEAALRDCNLRFARRFAVVETRLATAGRTAAESSLDQLEAHWQAAKAALDPAPSG